MAHEKPQKVWVESQISHLELLNQIVAKLPANERLEVQDLNQILVLTEKFKETFLLMCSLYGFNLQKKAPNTQ